VEQRKDPHCCRREDLYKEQIQEYLDKEVLEILQPDIGIAGGILELKKLQ
jgi:L-alanine-DL-glutamate epimerase-like enolase superfamily enzyme